MPKHPHAKKKGGSASKKKMSTSSTSASGSASTPRAAESVAKEFTLKDEGDFVFSDKNFGYGERRPIDEEAFERFIAQIKRNRSGHASNIKDYSFNEKRTITINGLIAQRTGNYRGICYWMFRDQRLDDNWALICAQKYALQHKCPLYVTFFLMSHYSVAGTRQYYFMLKGLEQLERQCKEMGIQFHLRLGYGKDLIQEYCEEHKIDMVVTDMMPLRDPMNWVWDAGEILKEKNIPLYQIDAHNIIPVWVTSKDRESSAFRIRPKINSKLDEFLTEFPALAKHPHQPECLCEPVDWDEAWSYLKIDETVKPVAWAKPGSINGLRLLHEFITQRLEIYEEVRNIPTRMACSYLSPYFHFGQLSTQRAILAVNEKSLLDKYGKSIAQFIEECVVRRELAENFCYLEPNYDNFKGVSDWARNTINEHHKDKREYIYTPEEFRLGKTHDRLWNAAQIQMVQEGSMHCYMRMYWAKKIYEWSASAKSALRIAMFLNDKYSLDGRDPNGYVGIMWSICGVHDRPFSPDRLVYGRIRYMSYFAATRKFDVDKYAETYKSIE